MNADMMDALQALAVDRGISVETLLSVLADAMLSAYQKMPGAHPGAWVEIDPDTGEFKVMTQETDEDY
ncbi:MAG TPA: NusA N-terminal domain-containing protein, partial [Acidimicrobiales bacterium]